MELKRYGDYWRIYHNGRFRGYLVDYGKGYELDLRSREQPYHFDKTWLKKGELKQLIKRMLDWDEYEVYSEYKAKLRGFKIIG